MSSLAKLSPAWRAQTSAEMIRSCVAAVPRPLDSEFPFDQPMQMLGNCRVI
jgi:hypothetical protein